jgi:hypothetical protein
VTQKIVGRPISPTNFESGIRYWGYQKHFSLPILPYHARVDYLIFLLLSLPCSRVPNSVVFSFIVSTGPVFLVARIRQYSPFNAAWLDAMFLLFYFVRTFLQIFLLARACPYFIYFLLCSDCEKDSCRTKYNSSQFLLLTIPKRSAARQNKYN